MSFIPLSRRSVITLTATALLVSACSSFKTIQYQATDVSHEALAGINSFRAEHGLGPVTVDRGLVELAKDQAGMMAVNNKLSHEVGPDFEQRMIEAQILAENARQQIEELDVVFMAVMLAAL